MPRATVMFPLIWPVQFEPLARTRVAWSRVVLSYGFAVDVVMSWLALPESVTVLPLTEFTVRPKRTDPGSKVDGAAADSVTVGLEVEALATLTLPLVFLLFSTKP